MWGRPFFFHPFAFCLLPFGTLNIPSRLDSFVCMAVACRSFSATFASIISRLVHLTFHLHSSFQRSPASFHATHSITKRFGPLKQRSPPTLLFSYSSVEAEEAVLPRDPNPFHHLPSSSIISTLHSIPWLVSRASASARVAPVSTG